MISDDDLHRLAIFLGSLAVLLLVLYHFLDINTQQDAEGKASLAGPEKVLNAPGGITEKGPVQAVKEVKKQR